MFIGEVLDGSGTHGEVEEGSVVAQGGPRRVGESSKRFLTGQGALGEVWDR